VRATFLDPEVRRLFDDWEPVARSAVARLRGLVGPEVDDPRLAELVGELAASSDQFRGMWERHDVDVATVPTRTINHPLVGPIELLTETLAITAAEGQLLIVYHADPDSPSERALASLSDMVVDGHLRSS
jgi:MmyB-like transcription regulator ligand binding domain